MGRRRNYGKDELKWDIIGLLNHILHVQELARECEIASPELIYGVLAYQLGYNPDEVQELAEAIYKFAKKFNGAKLVRTLEVLLKEVDAANTPEEIRKLRRRFIGVLGAFNRILKSVTPPGFTPMELIEIMEDVVKYL